LRTAYPFLDSRVQKEDAAVIYVESDSGAVSCHNVRFLPGIGNLSIFPRDAGIGM
jgi:hypothetical protein